MAENNGWIKLHRKVSDNFLYPKGREFTKYEAWIDLLLLVNHEDSDVMIKNEVYKCKRGQSVRTKLTYEKRWNWTPQKVKSFFNMLQKQSMIELSSTTKTTILTICNYDNYQSKQQTDNKQITNEQQTDNKRITINKNEENNKNENNEKNSISEIEKLKSEIKKLKSNPVKKATKNPIENARKFYENEIINMNGQAQSKEGLNYKHYIDFLFEKNELEKPFENILSIEKQLTFVQFTKLAELSKQKGKKILSILRDIENDKKYTKGKNTIYFTVRKWINNDKY